MVVISDGLFAGITAICQTAESAQLCLILLFMLDKPRVRGCGFSDAMFYK